MQPSMQVISKSIVIRETEPDRCLVAVYVNGKIHVTFPQRSEAEAKDLAWKLAHNESYADLLQRHAAKQPPVKP